MAVRRKLDLAGVKPKLSHWGALAGPERQRLVQWPDHSQANRAAASMSAGAHYRHGRWPSKTASGRGKCRLATAE